jgi:nicotinamidase-related amidase
MPALQLDRSKTAILCMDVHNFIVEHIPADRREKYLATTKRALDGARKAGVQVIYVGAERRADFSSARNKFTRGRAASTDPAEVEQRLKFVEILAPVGNEPIVRKPRMSAFYGSALDAMLRARDIDTLVMTGIATNFVVESTVRAAVDMDYRVIILEDCVTAADEAVHRAALASMEPLAEIVASEDFLSSLAH